jgi:hypothetical protein
LEIIKSLTPSQSNDDVPVAPLEWAYAYRRIENRPFTLEQHKPLEAIYNDNHKHIVVMKPAQVGVSELAITRVLHALDVGTKFWNTHKNGLNIGYLFPTLTALSSFSKERVSGVLAEHEHLANLFEAGFDDVTFKQAGASYLYLRGTQSNAGLKSFPADVLILDELDEMADSSISLARKRLRASPVKVEIDISTPTLPGRGIHLMYLQSDQQEWHVPCNACNTFSVLDFFRDVYADGEPHTEWQHRQPEALRRAKMTTHCPQCKAELNRFHSGSRWIARHPEITGIRGYHVPSLCFPMIDLNEFAVNAVSTNPTAIEEFFRSDLGVPYEKSGSQITNGILDALSDEMPLPPFRSTVMGVDVGSRWHYRITSIASDGKRYVRAMGAAKSWQELDILMKQYNVRRCVVDAAPETNATQEWANKHSGKVFRAYYNENLTTLFNAIPDEHKVSIHRTSAMDALYERLALGEEERWPRQFAHDPEIREMMKAPQRITYTDKRGNVRSDWVHTKPDHYFHASVYGLLAEKLLPKHSNEGMLLHGGVNGW